MTAQRARHSHTRHSRAAQPARPVPAHLAHLHPDWLPPSGYNPDGTYLDPADDLDTSASSPSPAPIPFPTGLPVACNSTASCLADPSPAPPAPTPFPTGLPREFNSRAGSSTTVACHSTAASPTTPFPTGLPVACNSTAGPFTTQLALGDDRRAGHSAAASPTATPAPAYGGVGVSSVHPAPPDPYVPATPPYEPTDENRIFHAAYLPGGREAQLSATALPLRHRIYALHCQGRSISAIARTLRLDRGTVARHLHAVEDLLLAEQTHDLARLRLRAVEAQHAVLAAAWDALLCEELNESDASNDHPYPSRRAQLLATAARAARTAAQLQGLFTPAALAAALQSVGVESPAAARAAALATPSAAPVAPASPQPHATGLPVEFNSTAFPDHPICPTGFPPQFNCGALAPVEFNCEALAPAIPPDATGLPRACNCGARDTGLPVVRRQGQADRT